MIAQKHASLKIKSHGDVALGSAGTTMSRDAACMLRGQRMAWPSLLRHGCADRRPTNRK